MSTERVINIHFVGGHILRLYGDHVKPFIDNYAKAIENNNSHFRSYAKDRIIIDIDKVMFVEETEIEVKDNEASR